MLKGLQMLDLKMIEQGIYLFLAFFMFAFYLGRRMNKR